MYETPFALQGVLGRIEGKETLVRLLDQFIGKENGVYSSWDIYKVRVYPASDAGLKALY